MKKKTITKRLSEYNRIMKENDELYRKAAKTLELSDCAFWILYVMREENEGVTQREICDALYQPKQTVNSALKKLEQDACITLEEMSDRRSKQIVLTEKGRKLAERTVDRCIALEHKTWEGLTQEEQETFIRLFRKYTDLLIENMEKLEEKNICGT